MRTQREGKREEEGRNGREEREIQRERDRDKEREWGMRMDKEEKCGEGSPGVRRRRRGVEVHRTSQGPRASTVACVRTSVSCGPTRRRTYLVIRTVRESRARGATLNEGR